VGVVACKRRTSGVAERSGAFGIGRARGGGGAAMAFAAARFARGGALASRRQRRRAARAGDEQRRDGRRPLPLDAALRRAAIAQLYVRLRPVRIRCEACVARRLRAARRAASAHRQNALRRCHRAAQRLHRLGQADSKREDLLCCTLERCRPSCNLCRQSRVSVKCCVKCEKKIVVVSQKLLKPVEQNQ
jgi:hypothetical protein